MLSCRAIALEMGVDKKTIERMRLSFELFGTPYPPPFAKIGRPRALTTAEEQFLLAYLEDQPTAYLDELALVLWDEFDVSVCPKTVNNVLRKHGWSRKLAKERAAQRSDKLRAYWRSYQDKWSIDQLCFVDESANNERTGARKRGWSPKGVDCSILRYLKRTERWSVLPALTVDGYLPDPLIIQGGVTKEVFRWWLINCVIPHLAPGSIIVMDNASCHMNLELDELLNRRGLSIVYLPPYSPDLNPIETTFSVLKAWVKRHFDEAEWYADFGEFMKVAVRSSVDSGARQYFKDCGYKE